MENNPQKTPHHKCINGFVDDDNKRHNYGDMITTEELDLLTSSQQRNFKTEEIKLEIVE